MFEFYDDLLEQYVYTEGNFERCKRMIAMALKYEYITEDNYKYLINKLIVKHNEALKERK